MKRFGFLISIALAAGLGLSGESPERSSLDAAVVWARHDADILAAQPRVEVKDNPAWVHAFTGHQGQKVVGWDIGPADAPVILWWHGGPGAGANPGELASRLANSTIKYRHIILDQPGSGEMGSAWVVGWKPERTVDDAAKFLKQRGVRGPVIVSGWSWGSTMSLLFAQRHPALTKAVVIGGVWANTRLEVDRYLGLDGARALIPGLREALGGIPKPRVGASAAECLDSALRNGLGGPDGAMLILEAEEAQAIADTSPRHDSYNFRRASWKPEGPIDMSKANALTRSAFIEFEMMRRAAAGQWSLHMRFPQALANVQLVVIQGRYDLVCDPAIAVRVYDSWPGKRKVLIPINTNHGGYLGIPAETLKKVGLDGDNPDTQAKVNKAMKLHFGSGPKMVDAAIEAIAE